MGKEKNQATSIEDSTETSTTDSIEMNEMPEDIDKKPTKKKTRSKKPLVVHINDSAFPQQETVHQKQAAQMNTKIFKTSKEIFAAVANLGVTKR
jgi:hypothetical protein